MRTLWPDLGGGEGLDQHIASSRPRIDAIISDSMREAVRGLARRCTVCVIGGRDRPGVQELMGVDDLVVAGSHGFDIWSPEEGTLEHEAGAGFEDLLQRVTNRIRGEAGSIEGALIEPKKASVAVHYRLVSEAQRPRIRELVDGLLADNPDQLKVTPGKVPVDFDAHQRP